MDLAHLYVFWYVLFQIHSVFVDVSIPNCLHTSAVNGKNLPRLFMIYNKDWSSFLLFWGVM